MSDQLMHYGVKGMRKGARKSREQRNAERRAKYEAKLKAKYGDHDIATIEAFIKKRKAQAKAARDWRLGNQRNRQLTATERREKYYNELDTGQLGKTYATDATLAEAARRYYKKGHNKRMGHSELMHYGVKGMKWGVRRRARRDAKEYTQAKMYYGEGAGNRRKLIKATVKARSKDPFYKSEFDKAAGIAPTEKQLLTKAVKGARKIKRVVQHDDVLAHYGVRGMRWGIRKSRIKGAKRWTSKKQAKIDGMSDDQLRRVNNRLRLEKEYRQLTQTRMERYRAKAGKVVEEAAANTLQNAIQKGLKKAASRGGSAVIKGAKRFKQ